MKALVITQPGSAEVREVEMPAMGADDVLVRSYAVGNKVVAESMLYCGVCPNCREGATNLCEAGYDEIGFTRPGGMAEYVVVPARLVHVLPDDAVLEEAALLEPASIVAHGFLKTHPRPGDVVAVVGTGTNSLLALQLARLYSPSALVVVGLRAERLEFARQFGATHTINLGREDAEERVRALSADRGADLVFEGDGHTQAIIEALHLARRGGSVILENLAGAGALLSVEGELFALNQLSVHGIFGANAAAWTYGVRLYRSGLLNLAPLISQRFSLDEYHYALDILEKRQAQPSPVTKVLLLHAH